MEIGSIGNSSSTKAFDPLNTFAIPADVPSPAAKKGDSTFTVADMPASFLATPETAKPADATTTPAAEITATDSAEPIKVEFGNGSFSNVATTTGTSTPAATTGSVVVSDAARSSAKSTLASIDAKLAENGYSKTIGNQRDRTEAVNAVMKNMSSDQKTKFLAELKVLAAPLGVNLGQKALDGGKAQFDALGSEQQVINRELELESKTGKSATPTATPAAAPAEKTASTAKPDEKKAAREAATIDQRPRSGQLIDRLNDLKIHDEAYAIAWAKSMLPENGSRLSSSSVTGSGNGGVWLASEAEVAAILKTKPTAEEFGRAMKKLGDQQ